MGGLGKDSLIGGSGYDAFVWLFSGGSPATGQRDTIFNFKPSEDYIDITGIDADVTQYGNQDFDHYSQLSYNYNTNILTANVIGTTNDWSVKLVGLEPGWDPTWAVYG